MVWGFVFMFLVLKDFSQVRSAGCPVLLASSGAELPVPVEGRVPLERVHGDVLLHQAVQQDGEGGEADVVQRQVGSVAGLRAEKRRDQRPAPWRGLWELV